MRIAYLIHFDYGKHQGILRKIQWQIQEWRKRGHEVRMFVLSASNVEPPPCLGVVQSVQDGSGHGLRRFSNVQRLCHMAERWQPDVVYYRFDKSYPAIVRMARRVPLVAEINSNEYQEFVTVHGPAAVVYYYLTRRTLLRSAAGLCCVTAELAHTYRRYCQLTVGIGNGIALDEYPCLEPAHTGHLAFAFVGTPGCPWHGVDRLLALAKARPDWLFELVGLSHQDLPDHRIPSSNVHVHGSLQRSEYERVLLQADVAIGPLALDRIGMHQGAALKTREYLAYGLPVVMSCDDTAFPQGADFLLRLDVSASLPAQLDQITRFAEHWRAQRVARDSVDAISIEATERERLEFFEHVVNSVRRPSAGRQT